MSDFSVNLFDNEKGTLLTIDNVFSDEVYDSILYQTIDLIKSESLLTPKEMKTANISGRFLSERKGLRLDKLFERRSECIYFHHYYEPIKRIIERIDEYPYAFKWLKNTNSDVTILGVYNDGDDYDTHTDGSVFTGVFFLHDAKPFDGGDLIFPELDLTVKYKKNRLVLFPGWMKHSVTEVKYHDKQPSYNEYRMSLTTLYTTVFDED